MKIKTFIFNLFSENTFILYDETKECVIIDPGCSNYAEQKELSDFIENEGLKPVRLLNTHCHIDHILGNGYIKEKYGLKLEAHVLEKNNVARSDAYAAMFGLEKIEVCNIDRFIEEGECISFGNTRLDVIFTPGHSPGHVVFYNRDLDIIIGGDVLFRQSIGRTDLPGGDFDTLIQSIREKLFVIDDRITVYPGHGPVTTIGYEKQFNPFLQEMVQ